MSKEPKLKLLSEEEIEKNRIKAYKYIDMTNEEIVKHIEHLKTLDIPELEKQGMISDWKKSLNQSKDE